MKIILSCCLLNWKILHAYGIAKEFSFPSGDPISQYILTNMTQIDSFSIANKLIARCFLDNESVLRILENKLKTNPADQKLNLLMGNIYKNKGDFDKAERYYKKHWMPTRSLSRL